MSRTLPISYDILARFYRQLAVLVDDLSALQRMAKEQRWDVKIDLSDTLLFKRRAIVIENGEGKRIFATSNFDPYFMEFIEADNLLPSAATPAVLKMYGLKR